MFLDCKFNLVLKNKGMRSYTRIPLISFLINKGFSAIGRRSVIPTALKNALLVQRNKEFNLYLSILKSESFNGQNAFLNTKMKD
jgi:hypothetical protein